MAWGWEKSAHRACVRLGKWISICFLGPENKRKKQQKTGQMAALVKAEDTGDRDKHEGLRGRSWGCGEPPALAGSTSARRSLRASPGGGCGDETGLARLSALVPKPLLQNAGSRRAGAGGSRRGAGLALQGLHISARQRRDPLTARELAEPLWAKPPSRPLPSLPVPASPPSCLGSGHWEQLRHPGRKAKQGRGRGHGLGSGTRGSAGPSSRGSRPGERQRSGRLPPSSSAPFAPSPAGKGKGG